MNNHRGRHQIGKSAKQRGLTVKVTTMFKDDEAGKDDRGTLVWVGNSNLEICRPAFRYCSAHFPQLAVRQDLNHCLAFPAQCVSDVLVVRQDRGRPDGIAALQKSYPTAKFWAMSTSECEGEYRTGSPWPGFQHFYWHQWNQQMPQWFRTPTDHSAARQSIRIVAAVKQSVESLAGWLAGSGHSVAIHTPPRDWNGLRSDTFDRFDTVIWDDSAAPAAKPQIWQRRLRWAANITQPKLPEQASLKHVWLCGFPRIDDWLNARAAGVQALISKPYNLLAWDLIHD